MWDVGQCRREWDHDRAGDGRVAEIAGRLEVGYCDALGGDGGYGGTAGLVGSRVVGEEGGEEGLGDVQDEVADGEGFVEESERVHGPVWV